MKVGFRVNGAAHELDVEDRTTLADALRDNLGLTGTRLGCEHGVCGSCTILLDGAPARSCLLLAVQCGGADIGTVEGLAAGPPGRPRLHPLQEAFTREHALQCGFCTPGFLMLLGGELAADPALDLDEEKLSQVLASNLCRCTGYVGIRRAAVAAARRMRSPDGPQSPSPPGSAGGPGDGLAGGHERAVPGFQARTDSTRARASGRLPSAIRRRGGDAGQHRQLAGAGRAQGVHPGRLRLSRPAYPPAGRLAAPRNSWPGYSRG